MKFVRSLGDRFVTISQNYHPLYFGIYFLATVGLLVWFTVADTHVALRLFLLAVALFYGEAFKWSAMAPIVTTAQPTYVINIEGMVDTDELVRQLDTARLRGGKQV